MAYIDVTFAEDFRRIKDGDIVSLWNDIDINDPFMPISADNVTLHGKGHILRGLVGPLFDSGTPTGEVVGPTVTNLTVCTEYTRDDPGDDDNWGGLFRAAVNADISGCSVLAKIHSTHDNVGAIAGILRDSTVTRCASRGNITAYNTAAGIVGSAINVKFTQCHNEAKINAAFMHAAGIVAWAMDGTVVDDCVNKKSGIINSLTNSPNSGGIVGQMDDGVLVQCSRNEAEVVGGDDIGGICGYMADTTAGLHNRIIRCVNKGFIHGGARVGGIAGQIRNSALIADNANYGGVSGSGEQVGGIVGLADPLDPDGTIEVKNNHVHCGYVTGLEAVHRVVGGNMPGLFMIGNLAAPEVTVTGDNPDDSQTYTGQGVRKDDPQLGGYLKHGQSCKVMCNDGSCFDGKRQPPPKMYCP
ncbi:hypothetical protein AGMMS49992_01380 [Clostridia bacterium]|nr:hypothetical protein AGMMS49992_01380 [Clostridia bacterium]